MGLIGHVFLELYPFWWGAQKWPEIQPPGGFENPKIGARGGPIGLKFSEKLPKVLWLMVSKNGAYRTCRTPIYGIYTVKYLENTKFDPPGGQKTSILTPLEIGWPHRQ